MKISKVGKFNTLSKCLAYNIILVKIITILLIMVIDLINYALLECHILINLY